MDRVHTARVCLVIAFALPSLVALGCGGGDGDGGGGTGGRITLDGGLPSSCLALGVPAEEPHLTGAPTFAEEFVFPTSLIEAEVGTDGETRTLKVELRNVFFLDRPPIGTIETQVSGTRTTPLMFPTEETTEGMFFMEITLCAGDCDEERFVYTFEGDFPETYQRVRFEGNAEVESRETCIDVPTVVVD